MKVLFTGLFPLYHYHFVAELNYLQTHIQNGDYVSLVECDEYLRNCECNRSHSLVQCMRCIGIRQHGLTKLSRQPTMLPLVLPSYRGKAPDDLPLKFSSLDELKSFKMDGCDLGMAVFSSLVDRSSNTEPDVKELQSTVRDLLCDAWRVWKSAVEILQSDRYDRVYIFNGRYAAARPWLRACQATDTRYFTHERSGHLGKYQLFDQSVPHEPTQYAQRVSKFWELAGDNPETYQEGCEFFDERPKGLLTGWTSFVGKQQSDMLPLSWDNQRRNISVFATTNGEYVSLRDLFAEGLYETQTDAFLDLLSQANEVDKSLFFYIRLHPNSISEKIRWWEDERFAHAKNVEIIPPDSSVSSYALLWASEKSVCFLSSVGLEATYWGKASMILGKAFYSGIEAAYEPKTREEVAEWLQGYPEPKPKVNAVKFGSYMRCGGEVLPYSEPVNYYTLKFKGDVLEARQEVHEWLGECEKHPPVSGFKKWLQDRNDRKAFNQLWDDCDGWFAAHPRPPEDPN